MLKLRKTTTKRVGRKTALDALSPAAYHAQHRRLQEHADRINPYEKPRGFVHKAPTRESYEAWRAAQSNPRLW
jgi:hypothetical protein